MSPLSGTPYGLCWRISPLSVLSTRSPCAFSSSLSAPWISNLMIFGSAPGSDYKIVFQLSLVTVVD